MYFNASFKNFFDMVSDSTLQRTFNKLLFVEISFSVKEEYHIYLKRLLKYFSFFQLISVKG